MSSRLYVGNLSYETDTETLRQAFASAGEVTDAHVVMDRESGRSRGFGFVTMATPDLAKKAIETMNGSLIDGRPIRVNEAEERPRGGGGGGAGGDVARHHVHAQVGLHLADDLEHAGRVAVRGVDDQQVNACLDQRLCPLICVRTYANSGAHAQAPLGVLRGIGILDALLDVLDRDQAGQDAALVNDR